MPEKIVSRRVLLFIIFAGITLFVGLMFSVIRKGPVQIDSLSLAANAATLHEQEKTNPGLPVRLKIPKINVDAAVEYVGLTSDWAMDVPKGLTHVGWFTLGARPGETGSAVIAGHYGSKNGKAMVFNNVYKLRKGDKLYVQDGKGLIIPFVVTSTRKYDSKADASDVFDSNDGKSHLNLITCDGVWNKNQKNYSDRFVIFTDKEM